MSRLAGEAGESALPVALSLERRALLALTGPERAPCADVQKIASAHLANVRKKLSDLVKLESILAETVAQCSDGATSDCPVLDILDAGRSGNPGARSR